MLLQNANNHFSFNGLNQEFLLQQIVKLDKKSNDYCDFYLQNSLDFSWSLDEGIIKSINFGQISGIGARAICGVNTFMNYSNLLDEKSVSCLVDDMFIPNARPILDNESSKLNLTCQQDALNNKNYATESCMDYIAKCTNSLTNKHNLYQASNPIDSISDQAKADMLMFINQYARSKEYVHNVIANLSIEYDEILIVKASNQINLDYGKSQNTFQNSNNLNNLSTNNANLAIASDIRPMIHISITIIVNKNGKIEKANYGGGGRYSLTYFTEVLLTEYINNAHSNALLKLDALDAPHGNIPVVLGNGWAGVILHEAVGHGLEGDFNRKGSSIFSNRIGEVVASDQVTVVDDGTIANLRGSLNIDDEGNPTARNVLIENGRLKSYMFDELNAKLMHTKSTGNGRRESFMAMPIPRMTNTFMLAGKYNHEEIIASVDHGVYVHSLSGGQVDITSGQFVFNADVAWLIKDGKLLHPVKGCALIGSGPECLKYVEMVGDNLALDSGVGICGKDGQSVPVGVGQPTIKITGGLVVGGV